MALQIKIERLGKVQTWTMPAGPFAGARGKRKAYEAGFTLRTRDFNEGRADRVTGPAFKSAPEARAWEQGYRDAQGQEASE